MNEPTEGRVLLVGEGNFSLSASLVEVGTMSGPQMMATCRESFTAVQENHQLAASNIDFLEKAGATVLFEVDATDLHNHHDINFYHFERVIFNFPLADRHNIKKNRELLSDFFSSVKHILDPEKGQVMVTLCKGQGGTPADQPMRSWHDSWQVVSMAANAGFILTHVNPFQAEQFVRYKSVGFRFQDKGFNTDSALTHVFVVASAVSMPTVSSVRSVMTQDDQQFVVPAYVRRKQDRWSLLDKTDHPVSTLLHHFATRLSLTYTSLTHLPANSPLLPKILPGYTSSLSGVGDDADINTDDDSGEPDGSVLTTGDGDRCQIGVTAPQVGAGDSGQQASSSKERKELENRQKVAAGSDNLTGGIPDTHPLTAGDERMTVSTDTAASNGYQPADRVSSSQPFQHGVEREGEGGTPGQSMGTAVPTFPPLQSPVFVLHTVSPSSGSHAGHDSSSQLSPSSQTVSGSESQTEDSGASQTEETMETEEEKSTDIPEPKRSKMDSDSAESSFVPPIKALFHLRCSLLENLTHLHQHMKTKCKKAVFTSGIVYCKCSVCPSELAASHEVLMLAEAEDVDELTNQLTTALKAGMDNDTVTRLTKTRMVKCVSVGETGRLNVDAAFTLQSAGGHSWVTLGHVFTFRDHADHEQESNMTSKPMLGAVLYMDTILLHTLRLPDVRLLWSEDRRFLEQFSKGSNPLDSFSTFKPISMYPVRFVHDISFWENPQRVFEEEEFLDVVREVTDDTVTKVSLVDRFDHADSGKTSRCYRLVFQSHDHALSYITSWRLQSILRLKVAQQLGVTLR